MTGWLGKAMFGLGVAHRGIGLYWLRFKEGSEPYASCPRDEMKMKIWNTSRILPGVGSSSSEISLDFLKAWAHSGVLVQIVVYDADECGGDGIVFLELPALLMLELFQSPKQNHLQQR